jgi:hypothetical protein
MQSMSFLSMKSIEDDVGILQQSPSQNDKCDIQ